MKSTLAAIAAGLAFAAYSASASAQISDDVVKIGVLTDMSSLYSDATGKGYNTTWPAGRRFPPEITIDHVLIDPRMRADDVSVHVVPRSDHRAVIATLRVPR